MKIQISEHTHPELEINTSKVRTYHIQTHRELALSTSKSGKYKSEHVGLDL